MPGLRVVEGLLLAESKPIPVDLKIVHETLSDWISFARRPGSGDQGCQGTGSAGSVRVDFALKGLLRTGSRARRLR